MSPTAEDVTRFLIARQPAAIRERILQIAEIQQYLGLKSRFVLNIPSLGSLDAYEVFATSRSVLLDGKLRVITTISNEQLHVAMEGGELTISKQQGEPGGSLKAVLPELMLFAPDGERRRRALAHLADRLSVAASAKVLSVLAAEGRHEIDDEAIGAIFAEMSEGVATHHARAAEALRRGRATVDDLVPRSRQYYELFAGPVPTSRTPDEYLSNELVTYRRALIERHLAKGLKLSLVGGLAACLTSLPWIARFSNDEIWQALQEAEVWLDPYSLLNGFEIALTRLSDPRFEDFARAALAKLIAEEFRLPNGSDGFRLLPLFVRLVLDRINEVPELTSHPSYWRRMCAWMHGGELLRIAQDVRLDVTGLAKWIDGRGSTTSVLRDCIDLRSEPMARSAEISTRVLRAEIVGRLGIMLQANPQAAATIGMEGLVRAAEDSIAEADPLGWITPGPLEGHKVPGDVARILPATEVEQTLIAIGERALENVWFGLATMSQVYDMTDQVIKKGDERLRSAIEGQDAALTFDVLAWACVVAVTHRDIRLADTIASAVCALVRRSKAPEEVSYGLQLVLRAAAANGDDNKWHDWLERKLVDLASAVNSGAPSRELGNLLRCVRSLLSVRHGTVDKAEAVSACA